MVVILILSFNVTFESTPRSLHLPNALASIHIHIYERCSLLAGELVRLGIPRKLMRRHTLRSNLYISISINKLGLLAVVDVGRVGVGGAHNHTINSTIDRSLLNWLLVLWKICSKFNLLTPVNTTLFMPTSLILILYASFFVIWGYNIHSWMILSMAYWLISTLNLRNIWKNHHIAVLVVVGLLAGD